MSEPMPSGLYDLLLSEKLEKIVDGFSQIVTQPAEAPTLNRRLAEAVFNAFVEQLDGLPEQERLTFANGILESVGGDTFPEQGVRVLKGLLVDKYGDSKALTFQPEIPLSELALLTNAKGEPALGAELRTELYSANRVDILMAFIKVSGLRTFYDPLRKLRDAGVKVRVLTSAYIGATEKKAVDQLVEELGAEVRIDYLARSNRLHAKAWLISRESGFSTAYIGSSNISDPALSSGLEWNVRLSETRGPELLAKFRASFDSYWESEDFAPYDPKVDGPKLEEALTRASGKFESKTLTLSNLDVRPLPHQSQMLDELEAERTYHDRHRNLVVAATGSGKTVLAALDYKRFADATGSRPTLLFVAHREEILSQSRLTFAQVFKDQAFGELLVGGKKPATWRHVFASVQSLANMDLEDLGRDKFDYIVVDEFHHATASTYRRLLDFFEPKELLGLTATPERADGKLVQNEFFEGRIATELRLWDALDQELLTPFHYFGIGENTDFTNVDWSGGYKTSQLSNVVTGNQYRDRLMFAELERKVPNLNEMKALVFCVDKNHAEYITGLFNRNSVSAKLVTGDITGDSRARIISELQNGSLQVIVSIDVFNEGIDVPQIDTLVMLRPTESPLLFLQQLGRGLRKFPGKSEVLVLDFVGAHRSEYRVDIKLSALTGRSRGQLKDDVTKDFPYLPSGVVISLDELARDQVLANIESQVNPGASVLIKEVKATGTLELPEFLEYNFREPWEIYIKQGMTWSNLLEKAGLIEDSPGAYLMNRIKAFLSVNDPVRFSGYKRILEGNLAPWSLVDEKEKRLRNMFFWNVWPNAEADNGVRWGSVDEALSSLKDYKYFRSELSKLLDYLNGNSRNLVHEIKFKNARIPLVAHGNYTRYEVLGATGRGFLEGSPLPGTEARKEPKSLTMMNEGVFFVEASELDVFFVTLNKGEGFSASTRYADYAETPTSFHWESQNATSVSSPTGKRYISQATTGTDVCIFVRGGKDGQVGAETFSCLGLADYVKHEGEKPIKIWWKLRTPMDLQTYKIAAAVKVA